VGRARGEAEIRNSSTALRRTVAPKSAARKYHCKARNLALGSVKRYYGNQLGRLQKISSAWYSSAVESWISPRACRLSAPATHLARRCEQGPRRSTSIRCPSPLPATSYCAPCCSPCTDPLFNWIDRYSFNPKNSILLAQVDNLLLSSLFQRDIQIMR
jgi:hypothetical protein